MPRGQISGFDYRVQQAVSKPRKQWIADAKAIIKNGGHRVVENGETLIVQHVKVDGVKQPVIAFEVYANIPVSA